MIEMIDKFGVWRGQFLMYRDDGKVNPTAVTNVFAVISRKDGALLGKVKWFPTWRQYTFHCMNSILDPRCLREVADFCEARTAEHKGKDK